MRIALLHAWSTLGYAVAEALLARGDDELVLVGAPTATPDVELAEHAARRGVPCLAITDRDSFDLDALAPDVIVVATFPWRLPERVLAAPRLGAFNVHPSLLPAYRGAMPEFWVVRNGEPTTGVTVHRMTSRFDDGPIVDQVAIPLGPRETLGSVADRIDEVAPALVLGLLDRLRAGDALTGRPQDDARASAAPFVRPEHCAFRWTDPALAIDRLVRACDPLHDAVTAWGDARLVVRRCRPAEAPGTLAPGEARVVGGALVVGTGEGALELEAVELEGESILPASLVSA